MKSWIHEFADFCVHFVTVAIMVSNHDGNWERLSTRPYRFMVSCSHKFAPFVCRGLLRFNLVQVFMSVYLWLWLTFSVATEQQKCRLLSWPLKSLETMLLPLKEINGGPTNTAVGIRTVLVCYLLIKACSSAAQTVEVSAIQPQPNSDEAKPSNEAPRSDVNSAEEKPKDDDAAGCCGKQAGVGQYSREWWYLWTSWRCFSTTMIPDFCSTQ